MRHAPAQWAWAIEYVGSPLEGSRRWLRGVADHPCRVLLFGSRSEARGWLQDEKDRSAWAFTGGYACEQRGNRIYRSARIVRVSIAIDIAEAA